MAIQLKYPTVDDLAERLVEIGDGAMMYKRDLSSYFLQIPLDPADVELFGFWWEHAFYWYTVVVMGHRAGPYIAQRVSNAIAHIYRSYKYYVLNYVDDFIGADHKSKIWFGYYKLKDVFQMVGVAESEDKAVPPTCVCEVLGVLFNTYTFTMEVTDAKLIDIKNLTNTWLEKRWCNRTDIEQLVGKLQFVAACVRPGRLFISRLLNFLRCTVRGKWYQVPFEVHMDVLWWNKFLLTYNGVSIMWMERMHTNEILAMDASMTGLGGILWNKEYYRRSLPLWWKKENIAYLEAMAVIFALKAWGHLLKGKRVIVECDNQAVVAVVNNGRAKDTFLQACAREICYIAVTCELEIVLVYVNTHSNFVADWLSRWGYGGVYRRQFRDYLRYNPLHRARTPTCMFKFNHDW